VRFAEKLLDAARAIDGIVEEENNFGAAAHLDALDEFVADEAGGFLESFESVVAFGGSAFDGDVDAGLLHIGRDANFGDHDICFEARVAEFAFEHGNDFVLNFFGDAFVTVTGEWHVFASRGLMEIIAVWMS
jgi:hypothetical protein